MGRPRKNTSQTDWRLPVPVIEALRAEAKRQGIRVGQLYEQILRRSLGGPTGITTAAELAQRMSQGVRRSAESNLANTLREFES
jgi:hypothetical protein